MHLIACRANFAIQHCAYWEVALYLLPSLVLAMLFRLLARVHPGFFLFYLSGTALHELAHYCAGLISNARPVSFSLVPRRTASNQWILGSVSFANIRWYNAALVGLAPLLILAVPILVALVRLASAHIFSWWDLLIACLLAPAYLSFLPSKSDWLIALKSWPYAAAALGWLWWMGVRIETITALI